jgi:GMP synthase-like glutamine amidotransferase
LANRGDADPGFVGEHLRAAGYDFTRCNRETPGDWPDLDGIGLVLALGSDWSVYWPHISTEVGAESALLAAAHDRGLPVFGICFGAQLLAHTLGGTVARAPEPEIGWFDVDSAVPAVAGGGAWFQWHADRFTVPPAAVRLGSSPRAEQAFRIGRTLALQFHPEVDVSIVTRWCTDGAGELARNGLDAENILLRTTREVERTRSDAGSLVTWFLEDVAGSAHESL